MDSQSVPESCGCNRKRYDGTNSSSVLGFSCFLESQGNFVIIFQVPVLLIIGIGLTKSRKFGVGGPLDILEFNFMCHASVENTPSALHTCEQC